jgi:hypothetical protein
VEGALSSPSSKRIMVTWSGGADAEDGGEAPHSRRDWVEGSCGKAIPCCEGS